MKLLTKNHFKYLACLSLLCFHSCINETPLSEPVPQVMDDRLRIELIASSPDIMTPIGLAIDAKDALYVLESHTHTPAKDYPGPAFDRIKKRVDKDGDGQAESWQIFADSITDGMNLAIGPSNEVFLVEKAQVLVFRDVDEDGVSDERKQILRMNPPNNVYDHAGLLGVTYSMDGWLYISRGNTGGQYWVLSGTDGSQVSGYGDGGNVMRCRPDGSQVEMVATGFWNPFDLKFSQDGRLMLVDNDPDSRGPNRLIEVVPGGDYGYQSMYGGSGIHPFLSWNGELPGTLPYAAGIGEAPCALIDASFSNFPADYQGNILSTIWEENSLVRIPLQAYQSTVRGEMQVLVQGDSTFHPVALATDSKGDVYLTDWVVRQYPNHGEGKIWRLRAVEAAGVPASLTALANGFDRGQNISSFEEGLAMLEQEDEFLKTIARKQLAKPAFRPAVLELLQGTDEDLRLQALLILSAVDHSIDAKVLRKLLVDPTPAIRQMTLIYIAQQSRQDLLPALQGALGAGKIGTNLFETYLATIKHLQADFITDFKAVVHAKSRDLPRQLPEGFILSIVRDPSLSDEVRAAALPYLEDVSQQWGLLLAMVEGANTKLKKDVFRVLRGVDQEEIALTLLTYALAETETLAVRAQALVELSYQSYQYCEEVREILTDEEETLQAVALRYLGACADKAEIVAIVETLSPALTSIWTQINQPAVAANRPSTTSEWAAIVDGNGNPMIGQTIFQSNWAICQTCHRVEGWGGLFGPDLSHIGSSKTKEQLTRAIIEPSKEISPEWQGWFVTTQEGETHFGRQIDVGLHNVELMLADGDFVTFKEPKDYGIASQSLMPEGLEMSFSRLEFNHLISYLMSLK